MLPALHRSLQRLIYERGNLDQREIEITFEAPTRERIDRLTRPTLCLFLYDIQENLDLRQSTVETTRANGRAMHRLAARRFDLHYMVSALTTNVDDEHSLLWRALVTLVRHPQIPPDLLAEELHQLDPLPVGRIYREHDVQKQFSVWSAFDVPPHPAFCYVISVPVELDFIGEVPLVLKRTTRYSGIQTKHKLQEAHHQIGGVVRDQQGTPLVGMHVTRAGSMQDDLTNAAGQFVLRDVPAGTLQLHISRDNEVQQTFIIEIPEEQSDGTAMHQLFYNLILTAGSIAEGISTI
jgi:uncharacterized protein DUF4255/carboxypeptidase family protein